MKRTVTWDSLVWNVHETESADSVEITIEGRLEGLDDEVRAEVLRGGIEPKSIQFDVDADGGREQIETESTAESQ